MHRYRPRGSARALLFSHAPEILLSGPAGTGKSRACLEKLALQAKHYDGMRGLIVRQTHVSLGSTALVTWRSHVIDKDLAAGEVDYYGGSSEEPPQYRFRNGSRIMLGGMDKPTRIMSSEYDVAYVQEAVELSVDGWEAINTRLRNGVMPYQQLMADTNPDTPTHWLKKRCDVGSCVMLASTHEENPVLFDEAGRLTERGCSYMERLDALTGVRYQRLRKGLWVAAEGVIFEEWNPAVHLVDAYPIPAEWRRIWVVDFGYVNPFVLQCWAVKPDGELVLYREIYRTRRLVEEHAREILNIVSDSDHPGGTWREPKPSMIICDHDAEGRATLERHLGASTRPARKGVSDGLQAVATRLKQRRIEFQRGALTSRDGSLDHAEKPACTVEEFPGYVWDTGAAGRVKEEPLKVNDHGMDATRYLVAELDRGVRANVRFLGG